MGDGSFRAIVRGTRSGCNAFVGSLVPRCYDYWLERDAPSTGTGWEILVSGHTKGTLFGPEYGSTRQYAPVATPEDPGEAWRIGLGRQDSELLSLQARSSLFSAEVLFVQVNLDRGADARKPSYWHYDCGKRMPDSGSAEYPPELDIPMGDWD